MAQPVERTLRASRDIASEWALHAALGHAENFCCVVPVFASYVVLIHAHDMDLDKVLHSESLIFCHATSSEP